MELTYIVIHYVNQFSIDSIQKLQTACKMHVMGSQGATEMGQGKEKNRNTEFCLHCNLMK